MALSRSAQTTPRSRIEHLTELEKQLERLEARLRAEPEGTPRYETTKRHIESTENCLKETREGIMKKGRDH